MSHVPDLTPEKVNLLIEKIKEANMPDKSKEDAMPHDCKGTELKVGDTVKLEMIIESIYTNAVTCDIVARPIWSQSPDDNGAKFPITLTARQVEKL